MIFVTVVEQSVKEVIEIVGEVGANRKVIVHEIVANDYKKEEMVWIDDQIDY